MTAPIRVLVVDDSAFARKVVREVLSNDPRLEVVGIARDGLEALERIGELKPDVLTLDLVMPNLDGLGVLRALPAQGAPKVVVVSISDADSELGVQALQAGAVELVHKPTALATERLYELGADLVKAVIHAAGARPLPPSSVPPAPLAPRLEAARADLLVIGTSTGGPQALTRLLTALPGSFPVPIAIVLHIPVGYTEPMARRLDGACALEVREAATGLELVPGRAVLARGGEHLEVERDAAGRLLCVVGRSEAAHAHRPAVDVLFRSAAEVCGARTLGLVLTGMGSDGLAGSAAIAAAGGRVLTESESSCVVYGMPRSVAEAGLSSADAPLERLPGLLLNAI